MTDNPSLSARMHKKKAELEKAKWSDLSIADRLTIRALEQKITVPFDSENGVIDVELRLPTLSEFDFISTFQRKWEMYVSRGESEKAIDLANEMIKIMADLCLDDSLNEEFFKSGYINANDFAQLLKEIMVEHNKRREEVKSFRDPKPGASSTVRVSRKTTT